MLSTRVGGATGLLVVIALMVAPSAWANLEQVGTFAEASPASPLITSEGVAVNLSGAGGVAAGTLYFVGLGGPEGGEENKEPGVHVYNANGEPVEHWGKFQADSVAIDQSTGDVYVRLQGTEGYDTVNVYTPDGSQLLTSFAVTGAFRETTAEGPEKVHSEGGIAVNNAGDVYLADFNRNEEVGRVMVFDPQSPGDFGHYVYAGTSKDIAFSEFSAPVRPDPVKLALDAAGNLYVASDFTGEFIYEFTPGEPKTPACSYHLAGAGLEAMTVDPQTGELYYYSYKHKGTIFELSACNSNKEFVQTGVLPFTPKLAHNLSGLAFDPSLAYGPLRPDGILYAVGYEGLGFLFAPAEARSPLVESESAGSVDSSGATVVGVVNPKGWSTHYTFQYITDQAYAENIPSEPFAGALEAPVGGGTLEGGTSSVGVSASLSGLAPDTEYHYRLLASSHCNPADETEVCEGAGAAQSFRTYPVESDVLPDGRAYELVSPLNKNGGEVFPLFPNHASCGEDCAPGHFAPRSPRQSSPDGETVVYEGHPFSSTAGAEENNEYLARRTPAGWRTTPLSPSLQSRAAPFVGIDASLGTDVLLQGAPTLAGEAPTGYPDLYGQSTGAPTAFSPLLKTPAPNRSERTLGLTFAGGSADYSKLFFEANDAFTEATGSAPAAVDGGPEKNNLYESSGGELKLVNVLPGNEQTAPGAAFGAGRTAINNATYANVSHAISEDGARVFWSDEAGQVFVREDGVSTREVPDTGKFLTASADGSKVLLADGHIYDLETKQTIDLTGGAGGFQGIAGQSEDLSHVYFVDTAVLTGEQANEQGAEAKAGEDNLYAWSEGTTTFVATLAAGDGEIHGAYEYPTADWVAFPQERTAEASSDGRWLTFLSKNRLTGYGNTGPCSFNNLTKQTVSGPCAEVFIFDSQTGGLTCASCNRSGLRPLGASYLPLEEAATASLGQPRYLTDGGRVFFDSRDSLSPFDTNEGVEDVYEYEPDDEGDCSQQAGCVRLISGGSGGADSNFYAMDSTGRNVFFTTRDRLVPSDHDELIDLYDAREGGGIQAQSEIVQSGECRGEACQSPATGGIGQPGLSSLSFEGPGDLLAPLAPVIPKAASPKAKSPSRAQLLARALSECRHKPKRKRPACERAARKRFGAKASNVKHARRKGAR